jgi:hypothetical protein
MARNSAPAAPPQSNGAAPTAPPEVKQPRVVWDDSSMRTSYANVSNVFGTREEVTLLFGSNQTWQAGQGDVRVILSDRIILNPYAAKRLLLLLDKGLKEYESRFGELKV